MLKSLILKIFALTLILFILDIARYFVFPNISSIVDDNPIPSAFMLYREAQWEKEGRTVEVQQKWRNFYKISPNVIDAVLIGEDDKFWDHNGFDEAGLKSAFFRTLTKGKLFGGSTITQQVAKNLYLSPSRNPARKIKEAIITWRLEKSLSKERILEIYLNIAEWGDGIYGIQAASKHYYHKNADKLTLNEAARLVSVLPNPIVFNPKGSQKYVIARSKTILKVLKRRHHIKRKSRY